MAQSGRAFPLKNWLVSFIWKIQSVLQVWSSAIICSTLSEDAIWPTWVYWLLPGLIHSGVLRFKAGNISCFFFFFFFSIVRNLLTEIRGKCIKQSCLYCAIVLQKYCHVAVIFLYHASLYHYIPSFFIM